MTSRRLSQVLTGTRSGQIATVYYSDRGVEGVSGVNAGQELTVMNAVRIAYDRTGQVTARLDRQTAQYLANAGVQIRLARV